MTDSLQPRVSLHHWALSAEFEAHNIATHAEPRGLYGHMLSKDFDHQHYAYDMGLEYDGTTYEHGNELVSALLRELAQYSHQDGARLFPELVSAVAADHLMYGR